MLDKYDFKELSESELALIGGGNPFYDLGHWLGGQVREFCIGFYEGLTNT